MKSVLYSEFTLRSRSRIYLRLLNRIGSADGHTPVLADRTASMLGTWFPHIVLELDHCTWTARVYFYCF